MARKFSRELTNDGFAIVSGLAIGIDRFAHEACINCGGKTVAVIATGFNNIYPDENIDLYEHILESGGCIVSEYEPNKTIDKKNFALRNRIISGLSLATLVIESSYRSGANITARYCLEQNRPLFCVPKELESKNSIGIYNLLKKGAYLVTKNDDITNLIGKIENKIVNDKNVVKTVNLEKRKKGKKTIIKSKKNPKDKQILNKKEKMLTSEELKIYKLIKQSPKFPDEISNYTGLDISKINIIISILELNDYIYKNDKNKYMVINNE